LGALHWSVWLLPHRSHRLIFYLRSPWRTVSPHRVSRSNRKFASISGNSSWWTTLWFDVEWPRRRRNWLCYLSERSRIHLRIGSSAEISALQQFHSSDTSPSTLPLRISTSLQRPTVNRLVSAKLRLPYGEHGIRNVSRLIWWEILQRLLIKSIKYRQRYRSCSSWFKVNKERDWKIFHVIAICLHFKLIQPYWLGLNPLLLATVIAEGSLFSMYLATSKHFFL
jgi:hypothetical protein